MRVSRNRYGLAALGCLALLLAYGGVRYTHHIGNLFGYVFQHGPYINRVFHTQVVNVAPASDIFRELVFDGDLDDRRWGTAEFDRSIDEQITVPTNAPMIRQYKAFLAEFFSRYRNEPDGKISEINDFLHARFLANSDKPDFDPAPVYRQHEKDKRPEDLIYFFANYRSACGTISESAVALLRELGFRTRLLRVSHDKGAEVAHHVFLEYFSATRRKWVMFDALQNIIPTRDGAPMSAFEFFADPRSSDQFRSGRAYAHYKPGHEIWFNRNGPIKTVYRMTMR